MPKKAGTEKNRTKLDWKKKRRQEYLEMKQYRYYIFCEGQQTEPKYFTGFKRLIEGNPIYKDMVLIEIEPCQAETMRVIRMAEDYVKKNKIQKGQVWFLLHFAYYTANDHRTEYASFLNDKFKELGFGKYQKNMDDIFTILMEHGNPKLAIRYAKRIIKDGEEKTPSEIAPGTKVYELVEKLEKYLPEKVQTNFVEENQ